MNAALAGKGAFKYVVSAQLRPEERDKTYKTFYRILIQFFDFESLLAGVKSEVVGSVVCDGEVIVGDTSRINIVTRVLGELSNKKL